MLRNSTTQYGWLAKLFHWVMGLTVIGLIALGLVMHEMEMSPDKIKLYGIHKSTGILILLVVGIRYVWRVINPVPIMPEKMRRIEKFLAHAAHYGLYAFMVIMPLSGWLMSSAAGFSVSVYGWFTMPDLIEPNKEMGKLFKEIHDVAANGLIVLISLHALAALLHHFYHKDNVLRRMLPFVKVKS